VRELHFQRGPQPRGQGPSDADASEYSMPYLSFFFQSVLVSYSHIVNTCGVTEDLHFVPVHFYELGTLFAKN